MPAPRALGIWEPEGGFCRSMVIWGRPGDGGDVKPADRAEDERVKRMRPLIIGLVAIALMFVGVTAIAFRAPRTPSALELARQRAATPSGFVFVPAGEFWMGSDDPDADADAQPKRRVVVSSFYIGRTE